MSTTAIPVTGDDVTRRTNEAKSVILFGLLFTDLLLNSTLECARCATRRAAAPSTAPARVAGTTSTTATRPCSASTSSCSSAASSSSFSCSARPIPSGSASSRRSSPSFERSCGSTPRAAPGARRTDAHTLHETPTWRDRYFFLTLFLGLYRIITLPVLAAGRKRFRKNNGMWDTSTQAGFRYTSISHIHKLVAAIYYFINIRAAVRLGDSIYYAKDSWVTLFHQTGGSQRELRKLLQRRHNTMEDIAASRN